MMTSATAEEKGHAAYQAGDYQEAIRQFKLAHQAYLEQQELGKAGEMANNLCVVYLKLDAPQDALSIVAETPQLFMNLGLELQTAQAYGNLASALEGCGDLEDAEAAYIEARDRFAKLEDEEALSLTLHALSQLQLRRGKTLEALSSMQTSLDTSPKKGLGQRVLKKILDLPSRFLRN